MIVDDDDDDDNNMQTRVYCKVVLSILIDNICLA